ncbi:hypothetical protein Lfu02_67310 [Longispora fulva]|uniref:Polyketide cyclase/dehydrase/lipid transport protein n=1 Tax=Longispora fulva TaxID=619741 RepID=A0A8J7GJ84_9ACTN|nr:SRPBCC family protein [Longispora fulva]MBG6138535.1 hypothetical protein [Longispora fulva]GIG62359.1 hypothetical protein Lfu02_67310 [Longispora fulva]
MTTLELDLDSALPPERVIAALTDFTEHRPDIWPGISRELYKVYEVGEKSALIREGTKSPGMSVWAKERYDWSEPGTVTWTVEESNFAEPGHGVTARVTPGERGGSHIHLTYDRVGKNLKGKLAVFLIGKTKGRPVVASFRRGLAGLEHEGRG